MSYNYDIKSSQKDNHANRGLAFCHTFANVIDLFISTFLIAHLYQFSTSAYNYCFKAGLFELISYSCMLLGYFIFSFLVAKTNRIWIYRLALLLRTLVVVFSVFYGEVIAQYIWLAGLLDGVSKGVYWSSYNVLKQEMVSRTSMSKFAVLTFVLQKSVSVVFPITIGALIEISTFSQVAIYVLFICAIQIAVSFVVKAKKPENSNFDLIDYFKRLKQNPSMYFKIKSVYKVSIIYGTTSVLSTLMSVCIMLQCGSNLSLGAITSVVGVSVVLTAILFSRFTKEGHRNSLYILFSIFPIIGAVLFVCLPSLTTVIIFNFCAAISGTLFKVHYDIIRNRDLKEAGLYQDISEHQAMIEFILCFVRMITYALVVLLSFSNSQIIFDIMLILFSILYALNLIAMIIYETKRRKNKLDW